MTQPRSEQLIRPVLAVFLSLLALPCIASDMRGAAKLDNRYPAASHAPDSQQGWEQFQTSADDAAPMDEAMGGFTAAGSPVHQRNAHCFPPEARNLFSEVDKVFNEATGKLEPIDYR